MMTHSALKTGFLIFPGFPMACLTSMIEPLRAANEITGSRVFDWELISESPERVRASAEVDFEPARTLADVTGLDYLILLSAPTASFAQKSTPGQLRSLARHGTVLGAVSGGVFPLVRSGVALRGKVSVHWCYEAAFQAEFPKTAHSDQVIERGHGVMTASGAAAAFDLALQMISEQVSAAVATEVACWFQHPMMRASDIRQSIPAISTAATIERALPPKVARAIEIYSEAFDQPPSVAEIADELHVSTRHLERRFKEATGQSPSRYLRLVRMKAARQLVMYTNDSFTQIANAMGYSGASKLKAHYVDAFGITPKEDRERINLFRVQGNIPVPAI